MNATKWFFVFGSIYMFGLALVGVIFERKTKFWDSSRAAAFHLFWPLFFLKGFLVGLKYCLVHIFHFTVDMMRWTWKMLLNKENNR